MGRPVLVAIALAFAVGLGGCAALLGDFAVDGSSSPDTDGAADTGSATDGAPSLDGPTPDGPTDANADADGSPPDPAEPVELVAGGSWTCALVRSGNVFCWGENTFGSLGVPGGFRGSVPPTQLATPFRFKHLAGSPSAPLTCGVTLDSRVACWGSNEYGQNGRGVREAGDNPVPRTVLASPGIDVTGVVALTLGGEFACAQIAPAGGGAPSLGCWGQDSFCEATASPPPAGGPCPIYATTQYPTAVKLPSGAQLNAEAFGLGDYGHTCAQLGPQQVVCWGHNQYARLGLGFEDLQYRAPAAVAMPSVTVKVTSLSSGVAHTCFVDANAAPGTPSVVCWGINNQGQTGAGAPSNILAPTYNPSLGASTRVIAGTYNTCGFTKDPLRGMVCIGQNDSGQLGDGTTDPTNGPNPSSSGVKHLVDIRSVAIGGAHMCAIARSDAEMPAKPKIWCWGANGAGQVQPLGSITAVFPTPVSVELPTLNLP
jgi:alpha-tubulin suppressor-like RCC1 family protein